MRAVRLVGVALVLVTLALPAPAAHAAHVWAGLTWYSDGTYVKSAPAGTVITAYATQARPNRHFDLVATPIQAEGEQCSRRTAIKLNPNVRVSSSTGVIGNTSGVVNLPAGTYQICFLEILYEYGSDAGTIPVHFTVT